MSIYYRITIACLLLVFLSMGAFGYISNQAGERMLDQSVDKHLNAVATNQQDRIISVIHAWKDRVALIASRTQLRLSLKSYIIHKDPDSLQKINSIIRDAVNSVTKVQSIQLKEIGGRFITQTAPNQASKISAELPLTDKSQTDILLKMITRDLNGGLYIHIDAPMILAGEQIGVMVVTLSADELLHSTQNYTGMGISGETLLLTTNQAGQTVYITPLRYPEHSKKKPETDTFPLTNGSLLAKAAEHHSEEIIRLSDYRDTDVMATSRYLEALNWTIIVKVDQDEVMLPMRHYQRLLVIAAFILGMIAIVIGLALARAISSPIVRLAADSQRIRLGEHQLRAKVCPAQAKELNELARSFNNLAENLLTTNNELEEKVAERTQELQELNETLEQRVTARTFDLQRANREIQETLEDLRRTQNELVESEKMAALGGLVAGVAHEINTPLGIAVTGTSHLNEYVQEIHQKTSSGKLTRNELADFIEDANQTTDLMSTQLRQASMLISNFKEIAVDQSNPDYRTISVKEYLSKIVATMQPNFKKTPHSISVDIEQDLYLITCPGALAQVLTILITNCLTHAFHHSDIANGQVTISAQRDNETSLILVADNGTGISPENLPKLFDPFFTTRRGEGGSGLGLSIAHNIVKDILHGKIRCESQLGQGTTFIITLPEKPA
ncbi:HAMP domain-containing sensor histidine kinase [Vibrio mangrovi]|uniref:histidine kinase n=1 Tax=Vibrio mangrovi TaxID=474394 RepID=A0A1Y6IR68_9VIBR|nr:ATP-binding protein [Vibrio mangrovi]MDW6001804.1 ATP-binding protein [Vibrio mangrovi]SMS00169.1 CAI-1 autoinducer sensor kinase/phosphatase CqsS [Vibrio mangrovi]